LPELKGSEDLFDDATMRWLVSGIVLAVIAGGAVIALRRRGPLIAPPRRHRFVPWSGMELALVLLAYAIFQILPGQILVALGLIAQSNAATMPSAESLYKYIWASVLIAPWYVPAMLLFLWFRSNTKPRHLGITTWRWRESLALAYTTSALVVPMVYGLNFLAYQSMRWTGGQPHEHPLQRLVESVDSGRVSPFAIALTAFQAVVAAPIVEEFVFRGVMLPWLSQRSWGGWLAMAGGIAIGLNSMSRSGGGLNWIPLAFVVVVSALGCWFTLRPGPEQWSRRAIVGTAILFAMLHVDVWPSPVPLLVLGLALGWCAHRSRNLLASITLHAIFNGLSIILMLTGLQGQGELKNTPQPSEEVTKTEEPKLPRRLGHSMSEPPGPSPAPDGHVEDTPTQVPVPGETTGPKK
jgi:membrane protease YdiL (CAAX protease family)